MFIFVPNFVKYLKGFGSYCADTISIVKFAKGHYSIKNVGGVCFLLSTHPLMTIFICTKVRENISKGLGVIERTQFP